MSAGDTEPTEAGVEASEAPRRPRPKRRVPALVVVVFVVVGALLLSHRKGTPVDRKIAYDLGAARAHCVALTVSLHAGTTLVRESSWHFEAGTAPERVFTEGHLPPTPLLMVARITGAGGAVKIVRRTLDPTAKGDRVIFLSPALPEGEADL